MHRLRSLAALAIAPLLLLAACSGQDAGDEILTPVPELESLAGNVQIRTPYQQCAQGCQTTFYAAQENAIGDYSECVSNGNNSNLCWDEYLDAITAAEEVYQACMQDCDPGYVNPNLPYEPDCDPDLGDDEESVDIQQGPNPLDPCTWDESPIHILYFEDGSSVILPGKKTQQGF